MASSFVDDTPEFSNSTDVHPLWIVNACLLCMHYLMQQSRTRRLQTLDGIVPWKPWLKSERTSSEIVRIELFNMLFGNGGVITATLVCCCNSNNSCPILTVSSTSAAVIIISPNSKDKTDNTKSFLGSLFNQPFWFQALSLLSYNAIQSRDRR